jgi:hypothetical protein
MTATAAAANADTDKSLAQGGRLPAAGGENRKPVLKPLDLRLMTHLMKGSTMTEAAAREGLFRATANMRLTRARQKLGMRSMVHFAAVLAAEQAKYEQ